MDPQLTSPGNYMVALVIYLKTKMITPLSDAILLFKRAICETIIDQLNPVIIEAN